MNFFAFHRSYNYVMATAVLHYSCVIESCSHKFLSIKRMLMHLRIYHPLASNARLRCAIEQCQHVSSTAEAYRKHVERKHRKCLIGSELSDEYAEAVQAIHPQPIRTDETDNSEETSISDDVNFPVMIQLYQKNIALFALKIRESYVLPKSTCCSIIADVSALFSTFFETFCDVILARLEENGLDVNHDSCLNYMLRNKSLMYSLWSGVQSDSRLHAYCLRNFGLVQLESVLLGLNELNGKNECYQYIPLLQTLKQYMKQEEVWNSMHRVTFEGA